MNCVGLRKKRGFILAVVLIDLHRKGIQSSDSSQMNDRRRVNNLGGGSYEETHVADMGKFTILVGDEMRGPSEILFPCLEKTVSCMPMEIPKRFVLEPSYLCVGDQRGIATPVLR